MAHSRLRRPATAASTNRRPLRSSRSSTPSQPSQPSSRNPTSSHLTPSQLPSAIRFGGLSARQVDKISSTIASVTEPARPPSRLQQAAPSDHCHIPLHPPHPRPNHSPHQPNPIPHLATFNDAPLNSRLPALTPRKASHRSDPHPQLPNTPIGPGRFLIPEEEQEQHQEREQTPVRSPTTHKRSHLLDSSAGHSTLKAPSGGLEGLDLGLQEGLMIEDLLFVLMGIEGNFIEFDSSSYSPDEALERLKGARFTIMDNHLDPSLRELVQRILPLATCYTSIDAFVAAHSHLDYGLVNHALCACIRDHLKEYLTLVVQLEDQFHHSSDFTLQRFWFHVQDMLHRLKLLQSLTSELVGLCTPDLLSSEDEDEDDQSADEGLKAVLKGYDSGRPKNWSAGGSAREPGNGPTGGGLAKGGEILAVLEERVMRTLGDPVASSLYSDLLFKASQPYSKMLIQWVTSGILDDPYEEFMVKESKSITRGTLEVDFTDEYWERKYALRNRVTSQASNQAPGSAPAHTQPFQPHGRAPWRRDRGIWGAAVVPRFLEVWELKILLAGKYVNVMRECGVEKDQDEELVSALALSSGGDLIKMNDERFYGLIDRAYVSANRCLLELLMKSEDLLGRLRSLKHHFFLSKGDSFTSFLDSASYELSKKLKNVNVSRLQNQFDLAIRNPSSSSSSDPYKEDVKVTMANASLTEWLLRIVGVTGAIGTQAGGAMQGGGGRDTNAAAGRLNADAAGASNSETREAVDAVGAGLAELAAAGSNLGIQSDHAGSEAKKEALNGIDALQLDYTVRFPLSLVISRKTILRYQLIFRYLLHLKHLEQSLTSCWVEHAKSSGWKKLITASTTTKSRMTAVLKTEEEVKLEIWKRRIFNLRAKMLSFVQSMYNFICFEVLEKNYLRLIERLRTSVDTVDGLLREHVDFLDTCLKECMLTNSKLLKIHQKLTTACSMFASYTNHFSKSAQSFNLGLSLRAPAVDDGFVSAGTAAGSGRTTETHHHHQQQQHKFELAEVALKKFEQNFNHHCQVHVDMVTYFASSENLALLALAVRLTSVRSM